MTLTEKSVISPLLQTQKFFQVIRGLNKPKWQLKVLFISLNCDFQKRSPKQPGWLGLWEQSQNDAWKSYSFSLNCDFQKKVWKQSQNYSWKFFSFSLDCDFQKRSSKNGQSDLDSESKKWQLKVLFIFIELRLTEKSVEANAIWQLKALFTFIELKLSKKVIQVGTFWPLLRK